MPRAAADVTLDHVINQQILPCCLSNRKYFETNFAKFVLTRPAMYVLVYYELATLQGRCQVSTVVAQVIAPNSRRIITPFQAAFSFQIQTFDLISVVDRRRRREFKNFYEFASKQRAGLFRPLLSKTKTNRNKKKSKSAIAIVQS